MLRKALVFIAVMGAAVALPAQLTSQTASAGDIRLYARLMAMTDSRSWDESLVDSALASSWRPLRAAATLGIGQIGARHGLPGAARLRTLLTDADVNVASNAAYALGLLVDSMSVRTLASTLSGTPRVAREAAWALGEIGAPARRAITTALADPPTDDALTIQLLFAAAKLRPVPVAELRPYLRMTNKPSVLWAATYAIARFRAPAGVRDLITLGATPEFVRSSAAGASSSGTTRAIVAAAVPRGADAYVVNAVGIQRARAEIARGLARTAAGDSLADLALPVLQRLVRDAHPHVRINAIRSLGTYEGRGASVVDATRDPDANVRIAAAQSLGTVLDSAVAKWMPLWDRDTTFMYRSSLLASATRARAHLPALSAWTSHGDWHYRAAALAAAGSSTDTAVFRRAARQMVRDADGRVRSSAYFILVGNDTSAPPPEIRAALVAGLRDSDAFARAASLGILARHPRGADVPAVLAAYSLSLADSANDARIAAIGYLSAAWKADSAGFGPDLRNRVAALAPSSDPLVRAAVDGASVLSKWPSTSGNPRPLSWYEDLVRTYVVPALRGQTQRATMTTRRGEIVLELFGADAPITVWNFMNLARTGYYRGTGFHRVVPNFVAQDGDPRDDGNGGPGYAIRDEMNPRRYERGALGMALSGPDTGGSQYFITHSPQPHLDGHYTVFGRVVSGYDALDSIIQGDRILSIVTR